jgi:hypothetical protein
MKKLIPILVITILFLTSCGGTRYGCPINAQHGFGPGR